MIELVNFKDMVNKASSKFAKDAANEYMDTYGGKFKGAAGQDGATPMYEFSYNGDTGDLEVELVGYEDSSMIVQAEEI